jgi:hypothetical protein
MVETPGAAPGLLERPRKALRWHYHLPRRDLHGWSGGALLQHGLLPSR